MNSSPGIAGDARDLGYLRRAAPVQLLLSLPDPVPWDVLG